jgi:hypothetical protein
VKAFDADLISAGDGSLPLPGLWAADDLFLGQAVPGAPVHVDAGGR